MPRGRTVPLRTSDQQKEHERRQALLTLDLDAARAWTRHHAVKLLGDDRTVLISLHETRVVDKTMPLAVRRESIAWLKVEHPNSVVLRHAWLIEEMSDGR